MRSQTSSSRVFEGFAAGVPIISDANPHVQKLFGDLVYYYHGKNPQEASADIARIFTHIMNNPDEAKLRVEKAQKLLKEKYAFDVCLDKSLQIHNSSSKVASAICSDSGKNKQYKFQIFLFHHHPHSQVNLDKLIFMNLEHCISALEHAQLFGAKSCITIIHAVKQDVSLIKSVLSTSNVDFEILSTEDLGITDWHGTKLGVKISKMAKHINAEFVNFINSYEYPHYDFFTKKMLELDNDTTLNISGRFFSDLNAAAPEDAGQIKRFNESNGSYEWSANSGYEHQFGSITFPRNLFTVNFVEKIKFFEILVPIVFIFLAKQQNYNVYRSRYITLRITKDIFAEEMINFEKIAKKGFWAQHYVPLGNLKHEINAGCDLFYMDAKLCESWNKLSARQLTNHVVFSYEKELFLTMRRASYLLLRILYSKSSVLRILYKIVRLIRELINKKLLQLNNLFADNLPEKKCNGCIELEEEVAYLKRKIN